MELRHLKSFLAVADSLSFVRAAQKLHLSPPALTSQIQKLEEDVGAQLFIRDKRNVQLSSAGEIFFEEARETLARAEQAVVRVQRSLRGEVGRLRIGFVSSAVLEIVPLIVVAFQKRYPQVDFELRNLQTSAQLEALAGQALDIGFVRLPVEHNDLNFTLIHREPFVAVLPKDHPAARQRRFSLQSLKGERFVVYGRRWAPGFFDQIVSICFNAGFTPDIVQETAEMYTVIAFVAAGQGVSILPRSVVLAQSKGIVVRALPANMPKSEIAVATGKSPLPALVENFLRFARSAHGVRIS